MSLHNEMFPHDKAFLYRNLKEARVLKIPTRAVSFVQGSSIDSARVLIYVHVCLHRKCWLLAIQYIFVMYVFTVNTADILICITSGFPQKEIFDFL